MPPDYGVRCARSRMQALLSYLLLPLSALLLAGCKKTVSGTYISRDDGSEYIDLKRDGSFYMGTSRSGLYGKYEVDGDVITFKFDGGRALRARIEGNAVVEDGGPTYAKRAGPPPICTRENEFAAVSALRAINTAEITYASAYDRGYSESLEQLSPPAAGRYPSAGRAGLVDEALASGTKSGYRFQYDHGARIGGRVASYSLYADPVQPGVTGRIHYYTDQEGVIRRNASQRAGASDPPMPD
jgi:hypothetical protein